MQVQDASKAHLEQGIALIDSEDFDAAISQFEKTLELDSNNKEAFIYLYHVCRMMGNSDRVTLLLEKIIANHPDNTLALYYLGRITVDSRSNYEKAVAWLERAVEMDDLNLKGWTTLGLAHLKLRQYETSLKCFATVLDIFPDDLDANCLASIAFARSGQLEEAKKAAEEAIKCDPDYAWAHLAFAIVREEENELENAVQYYRRAIEADPTLYEAYDLLGQLFFEKMQQYDDCYEILNQLKGICASYSFSHDYLNRSQEKADKSHQVTRSDTDEREQV